MWMVIERERAREKAREGESSEAPYHDSILSELLSLLLLLLSVSRTMHMERES